MKYNLNLNLGNEAFQTGKSITATEVLQIAESRESNWYSAKQYRTSL